MHACEKTPDITKICLLVAMLSMGGCTDQEAADRFQVDRVDARWANGRMNVVCEQRLTLSSEAREALIHGVPLTVEVELRLRNTSSQARVSDETHRYEISYLPLSDYYQLSFADSSAVKTFPRLRHVLAELSSLNLSFETGVLPAGDYELLLRTSLDQQKMPPPMRLPVLLSSRWHHDSSWSAWPLEIEPGA